MKESVAIIGSGISGLGCAHLLQGRAELTVFEAGSHIGGHSNTIEVRPGVPVDTGFMVFNEVTYPNLTRLFRELGVRTVPTDMSFSVQHLPRSLEYCGSSLKRLFAQKRNMLNPSFLRMVYQVNRFNGEAVEAMDDPRFASMTIEQYARDRDYGRDFLELYLLPMTSAVWSTPPEEMRGFPIAMLLRFFHNHGLLGIATQHPWLTVERGSRTYVDALVRPFRDRIRLNAPVEAVLRRADGKVQVISHGNAEVFDRVVLACHADQALRLLGDPSEEERLALGAFRYNSNPTLVHTDARVMPRARPAWASWNYRIQRGVDGTLRNSTHYWMNSLQPIEGKTQYFVSLFGENPADQELVDPEKLVARLQYSHPLYTLAAMRAQPRLAELNSRSASTRTVFCGSYFGYGFHEDGLRSGIAAAEAVLGERGDGGK